LTASGLPGEDAPPPRLIATIGLHSSASTWVFNVIRELMLAAVGEPRVLAVYADKIDDVPDPAGRTLVLKSHHGSAGLDAWLQTARPMIFLSIRDPRDAVISMARRFDAPLDQAVHWIAGDCSRLARLAAREHVLLRYEDRFFGDAAMPGRLARILGLNPAPAVTEAIFARYSTEAVRAFSQQFAGLPPGRVVSAGRIVMDPVTQIHRTHIGDGRSGKWRDLPTPAQTELTRFFRPFLVRWGYPG
jgi:hypothetical protein